MFVSLNGYKVIYADKVLNALELLEMRTHEPERHEERGVCRNVMSKPDFIAVLAINSDGNLVIVDDEAWKFQFIPRVANYEVGGVVNVQK